MQWQSHWDNDVFVVELTGKLMGGPDSDTFHNLIREAVHGGGKEVVIDMKGVDWLNSWGVGLLVSAFATMKNSEGQLILAGCTAKVMSVLRMTRFDSVFSFSPDVPGALNRLKSNPKT